MINRWPWLQQLGLFILLCCFLSLCYFPGLFGPLMLDDFIHVPQSFLPQFSWPAFWHVIETASSGPLGRPLAIASFTLNFLLLGEASFYFKLVNLGLHLLTGGLLLLLLKQLFSLRPETQRYGTPLAFIIVSLWLFHPLNISTVLYIVQRMTLLSTLFLVAGLLSYVRARRNPHQPLGLYLCYGLWFPLSILSKESGILMPCFILLIEYFFITTPANRTVKILGGLCGLLPILSTVIYLIINSHTFQTAYELQGFSPLSRLVTSFKIYFIYGKWIYWPQLSDLGLFHDDKSLLTLGTLAAYGWSFAVIGLVITLLSLRKKCPMLCFGLGWFLSAHLLESTLLPLELVFEHRNYLASIGLILLPVYYGAQCLIHYGRRFYIGLFIASILLLHFALLTFLRADIWSNSERFYQTAVQHHPQSQRAQIEWANILLKKGDYAEALSTLAYAKTLNTRQSNAALHILVVHCHLPTLPPAVYDDAFNAVKTRAMSSFGLTALDLLIENKLKQACPVIESHKIEQLLAAAVDNPNLKANSNWLSLLYQLRARSLVLVEDFSGAIYYLERAYAIYPKRLDPLLEKLTLQINTRDFIAGERTLAELEAAYAARPDLIRQLTPYYEALETLKQRNRQAPPTKLPIL